MALGRFKRAHPAVRIEASVDRNTTLIDRLDRGELDLALIFGRGARSRRGTSGEAASFLDRGQNGESHFPARRMPAACGVRISLFLSAERLLLHLIGRAFPGASPLRAQAYRVSGRRSKPDWESRCGRPQGYPVR